MGTVSCFESSVFLTQNTDLTAYNFEHYNSSSSHDLSIYKPTNFVSRIFCIFILTAST